MNQYRHKQHVDDPNKADLKLVAWGFVAIIALSAIVVLFSPTPQEQVKRAGLSYLPGTSVP